MTRFIAPASAPARVVFAVLACGIAASAAHATDDADALSVVTFACKDDRGIQATFYPDKVDLVLSDGRSMALPQTVSGSGIRYANQDETFVFWSKGDTAFVTEGADEKESFSDCVAEK